MHISNSGKLLRLALAASLACSFGATADAAPTGPLVTINPSTSPSGFQHPGLGLTTAQLEFARQQARADIEPWKSYYTQMSTSSYSSRTWLASNRSGTLDMPGVNAFNSGTAQNRLITDSWGALTQAVLYYMTGDNVYRANAMKAIRIWSNMDKTKYAYFADAHIHNGVPLYRLLTAAEILRAIPGDPSYTAYNLVWSDADTARLTENLIEPMTATFFNSNERYMNQHNYSLIGRMAGAIFTDNRARYDEAVEWLTVNATSTRQDQNGAISVLNRLIDAADPLNKYGYSFVQMQEMSRDQAHGGDNVDTLTGLVRMVKTQGTKVDPGTGKPSDSANAVSVLRFANNRLLAGANAYARYMLGNDTPFVDVTGGSATISGAYRGRLYEVGEIADLYNLYKYEEGVDVETEAPYLATAAAHANGPVENWGNKDPGPEAWLSMPAVLAGKAPMFRNAILELERKATFFDPSIVLQTEGERTFATIHPSAAGSRLAIHDIGYSDRSKFSPHGLLIRTNGVATMQYAGTPNHATPCAMTVPDTRGQWRYLVPDISTANAGSCGIWDNIIFYKFIGAPELTIDFDHVNYQAQSQLSAPIFPQGQKPVTFYTAQGVQYSATYKATDANAADTVVYEGVKLPAGATLDTSSGAFSWTPGPGQSGMNDIVISATDGVAINMLNVRLIVADSRADGFLAAQAGYDPNAIYTTESLEAYKATLAPLEQAYPTASDADYNAILVQVQAAVTKLVLVNPRLASDNTLNYAKIVASSLGADRLVNLTDNDYNSYSGDLRAPFYIDFGENYRVAAGAFGLQARYNFANRSQGANVYGSNDNASWTLLTQYETSNTSDRDFAMETIPVFPSQAHIKYRYFRVVVDHPGIPTDPAYPGISSYSEFHIHGTRFDLLATEDVTSSVKIVQSGLSMNRFTLKYTGTVTFTNTSDKPLDGPLQFRLDGLTSGVTLDNKTGDKNGAPYITLPTTSLAPGDKVTVTTVFANPAKAAINYTPVLVSGKY